MSFKTVVLGMLIDLERKISRMSKAIDDFEARMEAANVKTGQALDNIAKDQVKLSTDLKTAKDDLQKIIDEGGVIGAGDLQKLDTVANTAEAFANKIQAQADVYPDAPAPTEV